ncbi:MAG TPA: amidase [Candidatus Sulfotelmatobacter sp.]|nr:amidase [Candidatus Sulfotelmatobacter sp.]
MTIPTIAEASRLIARKELSPVELVKQLLERVDGAERHLNAFITLTADAALAEARQAEVEIAAGRLRGPLHGIPYGLKDIFDAEGLPTTGHSRIRLGHVAARDATVTAKLRAAGAVLMGKLATHEFAHGGPSFDLPWPPARNPWHPAHQTGGSSSGSGAAVAAGFVLGALGSDTGGSIRNPASFCGLVGLKPTYGLVSRCGVFPNSFTFDHVGPMCWTVEDCALLLQAIAGHDPADPGSADVALPDYRAALADGKADLKGLRVGVVRHFWEEDLPANPEVRAAMAASLDALRELGASLEDVRLRPLQDYYDVKIVIAESELYAVHEPELRKRPGAFGRDFLGRSLGACLFRSVDYVQAQRQRRRILEEMAAIYARYDLLVTAGPYGPAPRFVNHRTVAFWQKPNITTPFNVTGGPALVMCNGFSATGLPLSIQLVGRPFDEAGVLRAAAALEAATPWHERRPSLDYGPTVQPAEAPKDAVPPSDPHVRERVMRVVEAAGLPLDGGQIAQLCEAAPYIDAMRGRLARNHPVDREPGTRVDLGLLRSSAR